MTAEHEGKTPKAISDEQHLKDLYRRFSLNSEPTEEEIRKRAVELLADKGTALNGAKLIFGGSIDPENPDNLTVLTILNNPNLNPTERLEILQEDVQTVG